MVNNNHPYYYYRKTPVNTEGDKESMLNGVLRFFVGGGKRFAAMIAVSIIFVWLVPKDQFTWSVYVAFMAAGAGLDTYRRGE